MRKLFAYITIVIVTTLFVYMYTVSKFNPNIVEIDMPTFYSKDEIKELCEQMKKEDYLVISNVNNEIKNLKVYDGNINIYLNMNKFQAQNMNLNEDEAIIGMYTVKKENILVALDNIVEVNQKRYDINCIIENKNLLMTKWSNDMDEYSIDNQTLYLLVDSLKLSEEKNIVACILEKNNISFQKALFYGDIHNIVKKILYIFIVLESIVAAIMLYRKFKGDLRIMVRDFKLFKSPIKVALGIIGWVLLIIIAIIFMRKLLIIKLPFNENFTDVENIVSTFKIVKEKLNYKLANGFSDFNIYVIKMSFIYFILVIIGVIVCIKQLFKIHRKK